MKLPPYVVMTPLILMSYQSSVTLRSGTNVGVNTRPTVYVSAFSGDRLTLPPARPLYWFAELGVMFPYSAAVTPLKAHCAAVNEGVAPAHGSAVPSSCTRGCRNSSCTFGARTARWYMPRTRTSRNGAHCTPTLYVFVLPNARLYDEYR